MGCMDIIVAVRSAFVHTVLEAARAGQSRELGVASASKREAGHQLMSSGEAARLPSPFGSAQRYQSELDKTLSSVYSALRARHDLRQNCSVQLTPSDPLYMFHDPR